MPPFIVFALPRSRSFWLSIFLSYKGHYCGHDELRHCRSLDDIRSWLAMPGVGACETAAAPFWRLLEQICPTARIVTLRRPVQEILDSLQRAGVAFDPRVMTILLEQHMRKLDQIERRIGGVWATTFADLAEEMGCAGVFEHCLDQPHDHAWWARLSALNLQQPIHQLLAYLSAHAPQIEKLRRIARHEMLRSFRRPHAIDGVVFQQEPLAVAFHDGARAMSDECVAMGEYPEAWQGMNLPLLQRLEAKGSLHIYTARSNGRLFGYVVTALGEAFHAVGQCEAEQVATFADPSWPGLGRKLQQAAIDDLRALGVDRVLMFQPDGTRGGLMYRRLGAQQTGARFVLELFQSAPPLGATSRRTIAQKD